MKKLFIAIIAVLYFGVSSGMVMNIHYCMGKIASVDLNKKEKGCKCSKMAKKKLPCCKTEHKLAKLTTDQKTTNDLQFQFNQFPTIIQEPFVAFSETLNTIALAGQVHNNGPPLSSSPLYIQYRVLRI